MRTATAMVLKFWYIPVMTILFAFVVPSTIDDFFLPGSQPGSSGLLDSNLSCGCHQNFDPATEPYFNWEGSMMAQSLRDPLFTASIRRLVPALPYAGRLAGEQVRTY